MEHNPIHAWITMVLSGLACVIVFYLAVDSEPVKPVPTEATELMVETFEAVAVKQNVELARCMSLVQACERHRLTFDAQMKAVFEVTKKDICK